MKKELVVELNKYLADTAVLYIKWHNLHWNVVGSQFKAVHEFLEGLYDALADVLDEVAELLKMNEETPLASLKEYLAVTSIEELPSVELAVKDVISVTTADMETMKATAEAIRAMADEEDLYDVVGMMEDQLENYKKNLWFLKAMAK